MHGSQPSGRPRVLLSAYLCSPEHGSEAGLGWHRAVESAKRYDTWVITAENQFAEATRRHLAAHGEVPGLQFVFVAKTPWEARLGKLPGGYYLSYNLWQRRAFRVAQALHRELRFDLVHQVNFCGFREPGYLWRLDAPFVWGPVGGTQDFPWRFLSEAGLLGAAAESWRTLVNALQLRWSPRVRAAARRARVLLAANSTNRRDLARAHRVESVLMLETGLDSVAAAPRKRDPDRDELRILWSGEFTPGKCLPLLLKALAQAPEDLEYRVRVLGRGRQGPRWRRLARRLGIDGRMEWLGWLPHREALRQYDWADLFVFTSLRDTSGNVVLESLAAGLPVICMDHQGVHDIVTGECGVKVPVTTPREAIAGLREAVVRLGRDHAFWERCSAAAVRRAEEYTWGRQGERMAEVHRRVIGEGAPPAVLRSRAAAIKDWGKRAAGRLGAGLHRLLGSRAGGAFAILVYHRIAPAIPGVPEPTLNVTPERFRRQIAGLLDLGYAIRPLGEALQAHRSGTPVPPRTIVLTFDDGFASVYSGAWPVLQEFRAPATVFLSTSHLDGEGPFPFDPWGRAHRSRAPAESWRPLRREECREMLAGGLVEFGSHTHTHQDFRGRAGEFAQDLQASIGWLREAFGMGEVSFAFPFGRPHMGYANGEMLEAARKTGVTCALTTECALVDPRSDPIGWGRFNVYEWDTPSTLAAKREGWYAWAPRLQEWWAGQSVRPARSAAARGPSCERRS